MSVEKEGSNPIQPEIKNIEAEKIIKEAQERRERRLEELEIFEQEINTEWPTHIPHDLWWRIAVKRMDINIDYRGTIKPYLSEKEIEDIEKKHEEKLRMMNQKTTKYSERLREI